MTQQKIAINHEEVKKMVTQVSNVAGDWDKWCGKLASQTEILEASWQGGGGSAFGREMREVVIPAFKRLSTALNYTSETLNKLSAHWEAVDQDLIGFVNNSSEA